MSQNPPPMTLAEELKAVGGLPLTHDKLFREMFQGVELARSFLRFVLPEPVLAKLDLSLLTVEPKDFLSVVFKETRADMIYRIPIHGSSERLCVYVLLEHKSYSDFWTIFQADQYAGQISQREIRQAQDEKRFTMDFRLSPVLVIIFHHGEAAFAGPVEVRDVYDDYGVLGDYLPYRRAILFDLSAIPEAEVPDDPQTPELFAVLRIMQEIFSIDIATKSREVLERLKPYSDQPRYRRVIRFLWYYLVSSARHLAKRELMAVTEEVKNTIGEKEMPTILEQFKAEGKADSVIRILTRQHGTVPAAIAERVHSITDIEKLDELFDLAFDIGSLDEFAGHLPQSDL